MYIFVHVGMNGYVVFIMYHFTLLRLLYVIHMIQIQLMYGIGYEYVIYTFMIGLVCSFGSAWGSLRGLKGGGVAILNKITHQNHFET